MEGRRVLFILLVKSQARNICYFTDHPCSSSRGKLKREASFGSSFVTYCTKSPCVGIPVQTAYRVIVFNNRQTLIKRAKCVCVCVYIYVYIFIYLYLYLYRVAHEKPARRLVEQSGRTFRTLYRKLNKCKCKVLTG